MTAETEALITTVASAIAAVAGMVAAGAAVVAIVLARRSLKESGATIEVLQQLREAAQAETQAERATTVTLHMVLAEARSARELELLGEIARQVHQVSAAMFEIRHRESADNWHVLNDAKRLLSAQLAGMAGEALPACRLLASDRANPHHQDNPEDKAAEEIRTAIDQARERLVGITHVANAQLKQLADAALFVVIPDDLRVTPRG